MSTTSAIFKGFTATILASLVALAFKELSVCVLAAASLPILGFFLMDIFYLGLERKYRALYERVRTGAQPLDYSLSTQNITKDEAHSGVLACLSSQSILLFYIPCIVAYIILAVLKILGFK